MMYLNIDRRDIEIGKYLLETPMSLVFVSVRVGFKVDNQGHWYHMHWDDWTASWLLYKIISRLYFLF
jgi:hypothetical protein